MTKQAQEVTQSEGDGLQELVDKIVGQVINTKCKDEEFKALVTILKTRLAELESNLAPKIRVSEHVNRLVARHGGHID